jgi:hypothetical protein
MSEQDETLNIVLDFMRGVVISLASATNADMGKIVDAMAGLSESPQFNPKASAMLAHLAKEWEPLRSPKLDNRER